MANPTLFTTWRGTHKSMTTSTGTVQIEPVYDVYADMTAGTGGSHLQLPRNGYVIRSYEATNVTLRNLLPIRLDITVNGVAYVFTVTTSTSIQGSSGNYYVAVPIGTSAGPIKMAIPNNGTEFSISTTVTTNYGDAAAETLSFTQQACGTLYNSLSGETGATTPLVTGRIYTYTLVNAAVTTEKIKPIIRFGYYLGDKKTGDPSANIPVSFQDHQYTRTWYLADHWKTDSGAYTEAQVAISCRKSGAESAADYPAPHRVTFLSNTYNLRCCFTQYYETSDFQSNGGTDFTGILLGNSSLDITKRGSVSGTAILGRDSADEDLRPQITGLTLTDSLRRDIDYIDWHGGLQQHSKTLRYTGSAITKYGNLVAGYSFCNFEPQIDWKFGDTDYTGNTREAKAFVNDDVSGTDILVKVGVNYYIQYQVPDRATEQIRIEVEVTGSLWHLKSQKYTETYSTITYRDPQLQDWEITRCTILYYQATDPWRGYPSSEKRKHIGDLWYCTADITEGGEVVYEAGKTYRMSAIGPTSYGWKEYDEEYTYFTYGNTRYVAYPQGNYVKIEFTASFSELNGHNTEKLIYVRENVTNTYLPTVDLYTTFKVIELSANSSMDVQFVLQDDLCAGVRGINNGAEYKHKAETTESVIDFMENSYAIGVGKISETDKMMDIRDGWTLRAYNVVIGGYTPPQIEDEPPPSARDQNLKDWMKNVEHQLHDLESRRS